MNIDNEDVKTTNCIKEPHNNGNIKSWRHNQENINRVFKFIFSKEKHNIEAYICQKLSHVCFLTIKLCKKVKYPYTPIDNNIHNDFNEILNNQKVDYLHRMANNAHNHQLFFIVMQVHQKK